MDRESVSALVPTFNSSQTLHATLESLKWAEEIVVVDSFSTDATIEIAGQYGAKVLSHEYVNSATQKNWALSECTCAWVLQVDSDEVLSPELRDEIALSLKKATSDIHAFRIPRMNYFLGRWMEHGGNYPDYQTRLFRRGDGRWEDREVHAHIQVSGRVETLKSPIVHNDWPTLSKMVTRLDRYTRYEADELSKQGAPFHWSDLVLRPVMGFLYRYIWLQGFRDGWRGLIFCVYTTFYLFLTRAKLWELRVLGVDRSPHR
jgi:glycosyltransferase involved in cell wall biosynthesis